MDITRYHTGERMSEVMVHGNTVYTAGQGAQNAPGTSVTEQTKDILATMTMDALLAEAGTDKSTLLTATIWLNAVDDFAEMNAILSGMAGWCQDRHTCRACVESPKLASPKFTVEIMAIAALWSSVKRLDFLPSHIVRAFRWFTGVPGTGIPVAS